MRQLTIVFVFAGWLAATTAQAQTTSTGFEIMEVAKIAEVYRQASNLRFHMKYTYSDSVNTSTVMEEMEGDSYISEGRYRTTLGDVTIVQGYQQLVTVYRSDSLIAVADRHAPDHLMQVPILDSVFQEAHVTEMTLAPLNDTTQVLTILFDANSKFSKYQLYYHKNKYYMSEIRYYLKEYAADAAENMSGTSLIKVVLNQYSEAVVDQSLFREDQYIYKQNGTFYTKPGYAAYRLINTTTH